MLLLWSCYEALLPRTGGERFIGTFEGIDEFMLVREAPFVEEFDDDDVIIAWWINRS
jgi:hypothetical protein